MSASPFIDDPGLDKWIHDAIAADLARGDTLDLFAGTAHARVEGTTSPAGPATALEAPAARCVLTAETAPVTGAVPRVSDADSGRTPTHDPITVSPASRYGDSLPQL